MSNKRWPVRRAPGWLIAAVAAFIATAVLVGLAHRPSNRERAVDLHGLIKTLNTGIESCAGGLRDSLTALSAIETGTNRDAATAISIARGGAVNCSPANNQQLADLAQYQVPESLARFALPATVNDLITWAFPWAQRVQRDIAGVLSAPDSLRAQVYRDLSSVARSLGSNESPPDLPR